MLDGAAATAVKVPVMAAPAPEASVNASTFEPSSVVRYSCATPPAALAARCARTLTAAVLAPAATQVPATRVNFLIAVPSAT